MECTTPSSLLPSPIVSVTRLASVLEMLVVLHVQFQQGRGLRQPVGDALNQAQSVEPGEHEFRALFLGHPRDVERNRRVRDDPRDQDAFAFEQSCHVRFFSFVG